MFMRTRIWRMALDAMLVLCVASHASWGADTSPKPGTEQDSNQLLQEQFGPFKLSVGENDAGGIGANLNGSGRWDFGRKYNGLEKEDTPNKPWIYWFPSLVYSATGTWSSKADSTNNASLSVRPGIDWVFNYGRFHDYSFDTDTYKQPIVPTPDGTHRQDATGKIIPPIEYPDPKLGFGFAGDAELRYGNAKQGSSMAAVREFLVGGTLYAVALTPRPGSEGFFQVIASPHLSLGYYHPSSPTSTNDIPLPDTVKANYIQSSVETVLGFGAGRNPKVELDVKYDGSKPTSGMDRAWQNLWTVKVWIPGLKFNNVSPSVTYQSGANGGFSYDRQVLIGVLVEFLDPKK
jgi:hypothetical protein